MIKLLLKYKWYTTVLLLLIIAEPVLNSVLNFWLQEIFSSAFPGASVIGVLRLLTIGFLLWLMKRLISYFSAVIKAKYICDAKRDVKHKMFVSLMGVDASPFTTATSGEYLSLFTNDINLIETRFFNQIINLVSNVFSLAILGTSFIILCPSLAVAILLFGLLSMSIPLIFSKKLNEKNLSYSQTISKFTAAVKEFMVGFPTIKNYNIESEIAEKFVDINTTTEESKFEADCALSLANNVGQLMSWFMQFIGVGLGLILVIRGEIIVGTVVAAQAFANDLALPLQNIIMNINSINSIRVIVKKLENASKPIIPQRDNGKANAVSVLKNDDCGYEINFLDLQLIIDGNTIIDHFTYRFEAGKKYLMIGVNGSGKSSVFRTLKRWFHEYSGRITINGIEVSDIDSYTLSRAVSYMNESVCLFTGTVRENISLFHPYTDENLFEAVKGARVLVDLERTINSEGMNISSGEKRRIEIARSLIESAGVLIFDEVASALDIETAYEIEKMALHMENKTTIFVSHNFSGELIKEYDEILIMHKGRLVAHGTYDTLIENCNYFQNICKIKFGQI